MNATPQRPDPALSDRDTAVVAGLAAGHSVAAVAAGCGCSASTVHRRLREPAVRAALADARADRFREPATAAVAALPRAVARLIAILDDDAAHPSSRIRAAEALLHAALKLDEHADVLGRLARLEQSIVLAAGDAAARRRDLDALAGLDRMIGLLDPDGAIRAEMAAGPGSPAGMARGNLPAGGLTTRRRRARISLAPGRVAGPHPAGDEAQFPALVRHAPDRGRVGQPHRPGTPRPRGCRDDDDLHARPEQGRPGRAEPAGPLVRGRGVD